MRRAVGWLLLLGVGLTQAQDKFAARRLPSASKLHTTLLALKDAAESHSSLSQHLVGEIMSLADSDRQPSRYTVVNFADELTNALLGKNITKADAMMLEESINAVLRSTGATFTEASHFRETLARIGVDAAKLHAITRRFMAIAEEVRGPDDLPITSNQ